jgi:Zn-dependent protease with chaperone function
MSARRGGRRVSGTTLLLLVPLVPLVLFGVARAAAPASLIGLFFDDPWNYALFAALLVLAGAFLMAWKPFEAWAARVLFGMRPPTPEERAQIEPPLERVAARAGIEPGRLLLRVEEASKVNAYAGAGHILCVTTGALGFDERQLEAVLAHELGHHRELHPAITGLAWWLSLPAVPLKAALRFLRLLIGAIVQRLRGLLRPFAYLIVGVLWLVTIQLLWLVWVADVLSAAIARRTEFVADGWAVEWGYAPALLDAYEELGAVDDPPGRLAKLMAQHPPMTERVARIERATRELG